MTAASILSGSMAPFSPPAAVRPNAARRHRARDREGLAVAARIRDLRQIHRRRRRAVRLMTSQDRYSAAVHEAGHVVVAWALELKTRKMVVGIDGDDTAGAAEIEESPHLLLVDQIAICSVGADARRMFDAPTHEVAAFSDMVKIANLVDDFAEDEGEALRYAGYRRSKELLELHRAKVDRLAQALAERAELDQAAIEQILISNG